MSSSVSSSVINSNLHSIESVIKEIRSGDVDNIYANGYHNSIYDALVDQKITGVAIEYFEQFHNPDGSRKPEVLSARKGEFRAIVVTELNRGNLDKRTEKFSSISLSENEESSDVQDPEEDSEEDSEEIKKVLEGIAKLASKR